VGLQHVDYINCLFVAEIHVDNITVYLMWGYNM